MPGVTLADTLEHHLATDALEATHLDVIRRFVAVHEDPFARSILDGHCTGSAFVVSADGTALMLVFHRKLACWLQPGGHAEPGETRGEAVALREAREETGIDALTLHPTAPRPIDVDVHRIPAFGDVPAHDHLDLRYLAVAPSGAVPAPDAAEIHQARWFTWEELDTLPLDRPMRRALAKVRAWLTPLPGHGAGTDNR